MSTTEKYQCIHTKSLGCENCDLATKSDIHCSDVFEIRGECLSCYRKDGKSVIFKKLKKVGEPEIINGKKVQSIVTGYVGCAFCIFKKGGACLSGGTCKNRGTRIYVEIKQNKEDMEEKHKNIDWEQRRYEIAKDMMTSAEQHNNDTTGFKNTMAQAQYAIECADALIAELKKAHV